MFLNTIIHILEAITVALIALTAFQIHRCSREFYQSSQANNSAVSPVTDTPINVSKSEELSTNPVDSEKPVSVTNSVLNDYIGEFFAEAHSEPVTNIQAFKVSQPEQVENLESSEVIVPVLLESQLVSTVVSIDEKSSSQNVAAIEDSEDDSVITVMPSSSSSSGSEADNIMSDKVVHAMLDEAKIVCVS